VFSRLADTINRHPWRVLTVALAITAVSAALGINVPEHLKPRGFDVAGSGSAQARELIAQASGTDPASSVLALVRLSAPVNTPSSRRRIAAVEAKLRRDPAVVTVLDARSAQNPAMIAHDRRSTYLIAALRPLDDKKQEEAGKRLLAAFADDPHVTLDGSPVANQEISKTIEDDLRRAELLAVPLSSSSPSSAPDRPGDNASCTRAGRHRPAAAPAGTAGPGLQRDRFLPRWLQLVANGDSEQWSGPAGLGGIDPHAEQAATDPGKRPVVAAVGKALREAV
jgi:hypothetical protein